MLLLVPSGWQGYPCERAMASSNLAAALSSRIKIWGDSARPSIFPPLEDLKNLVISKTILCGNLIREITVFRVISALCFCMLMGVPLTGCR